MQHARSGPSGPEEAKRELGQLEDSAKRLLERIVGRAGDVRPPGSSAEPEVRLGVYTAPGP